MADGLFQTGDTERALELVEGLVKMIQPMPNTDLLLELKSIKE